MHALGADAQRVELAAPHVAHDQEAQHLLEEVAPRVDLSWWSAAPSARALSSSVLRAAAASMPPRVHGDGDDRAAVVSLSHGMQNEVSSPPEKASTMGFCDDEERKSWRCLLQVLPQPAARAGAAE